LRKLGKLDKESENVEVHYGSWHDLTFLSVLSLHSAVAWLNVDIFYIATRAHGTLFSETTFSTEGGKRGISSEETAPKARHPFYYQREIGDAT